MPPSTADVQPVIADGSPSPTLRTERAFQPPASPALPLADVLRAIGGGALLVWLLGAAWLVLRWWHGLLHVAALRKTSQPLDRASIAELLSQVRQALGVERLPSLATSAGVDRPLMVGLIQPLVVLPQELVNTLPWADLADVLIHECAHAVCGHQVVGLLQRLAATLFWPHPLVHLLNRELAQAREEICDNYVVRYGDAPRYARTLLELSQVAGNRILETSGTRSVPLPLEAGRPHCRPFRQKEKSHDSGQSLECRRPDAPRS